MIWFCLCLISCTESSAKTKDGFLFPVLAECEGEVKKGLQTGINIEEYEINYFDQFIRQSPSIKGYARVKKKYDDDPHTYTALVNTIYAECYGDLWKEIDKTAGFGEELERTIRINESLGYKSHRIVVEDDVVKIFFTTNEKSKE